MTISEMIKQLKAAGYSVIRTERLGTLYTQFEVDPLFDEIRKDWPDYLEYAAKSAAAGMAHKLTEELFETLQFKCLKDQPQPYFNTYRAEITFVRPAV